MRATKTGLCTQLKKKKKTECRRLETDMEALKKDMEAKGATREDMTSRSEKTEQQLKPAQTLCEQICAGMTEHKAVAKENADLRHELESAKDELMKLRKRDEEAARRISASPERI